MEFLKESKRAGSSPALSVRVAIIFAVIGCAMANAASAADDDYMFCYAKDNEAKVTYFSEIFPGDYFSRSTRAKLDFDSYLENVGINVYSFNISCTYEDTYKEAEIELDYTAIKRQRFPYDDWSVVRTNWIPGYARPLPPSNSSRSDGRESGGDGCYFGECPDGGSLSQQTVCEVYGGWCEAPGQPINQRCYCVDSSGREYQGFTAQRQ